MSSDADLLLFVDDTGGADADLWVGVGVDRFLDAGASTPFDWCPMLGLLGGNGGSGAIDGGGVIDDADLLFSR